jgi:hypothetical protein
MRSYNDPIVVCAHAKDDEVTIYDCSMAVDRETGIATYEIDGVIVSREVYLDWLATKNAAAHSLAEQLEYHVDIHALGRIIDRLDGGDQ